MIAKHKGEVPFLVYLLPFIAGIVASVYLEPGRSLLPLLLFSVCVFAFIAVNLLYSRLHIYKRNWLGGLLIHLCFFFGALAIVQFRDTRSEADYFAKQNNEQVLIRVNTEPNLKGKYWHFSGEVTGGISNNKYNRASGKLMLTILADSAHTFKYGDELLIPANYKPVDPPFNPAAFNYKNYLANQHIYRQSFLFPGQYRLIAHDKGNSIISYSLNLRQRFVDQFKANIKDTDAAAVATTLILGYKANLSPDVVKVYSKTGTIHVLSVSGAHVAIVYVFISFLLGFMPVSSSSRWIKSVLTILLIWGYVMLTGFSPPVCRAAIMLSAIIAGRSGYRHVNQLNLLAFSAMMLLIYDPLLITDIGFQLSYLAVFGLIALQPVIVKWLTFENKWAQKLWYLISASLAAQVITFPLSAFYFHQFPLYFLLSNLLIIIPSELALFCGILAMFFGRVVIIGTWIYKVLEWTIVAMNKGLSTIERQPYSSIDKMWFTRAECVLLFIAIMALFYFAYNKRRVIFKFSLICFLLLSVSFTVKTIEADETNSITFFSINKHTAILFKRGKKGVLISDVKPVDQLYNYNVKPAVDSSGISDLSIIAADSGIQKSWFKKNGHLVQFRDKTLLLFDKQIENFIPRQTIPVTYLYVSNNPQTSVGFLQTYYKFDLLIIDSTNSPAAIKRLSAEAARLKIKYFVLKRNKSLFVVSK